MAEKPVAPEIVADSAELPTVTAPVDVRSVALSVIAGVAAVHILHFGQVVLVPIALAVLISFPLGQLVSGLERLRLPRSFGAAIVLAALIAGLGYASLALRDEALAIVEDLPVAAQKLRAELRSRRRADEGALEKVQKAAKEIEQTAQAASAPPPAAPRDVTRVQIVEPAFRVQDYLWWGSMGLVALGGQLLMILFLVYFLLVAGDLYKRKVVKIASPRLSQKKITVQILDSISTQIASFIRIQVLTSAIVGVVTAVMLWWFGLEQYVVWGIAAGIFNSIPYFGPVIVSGGLFVVASLQFHSWATPFSIAAAALAITALEGNLLTPALISKAARMNPVAIFVGLIFWSWIWGVWGMVLAVPMLMMIKAVCDHVDDLQAVGELLGD